MKAKIFIIISMIFVYQLSMTFASETITNPELRDIERSMKSPIISRIHSDDIFEDNMAAITVGFTTSPQISPAHPMIILEYKTKRDQIEIIDIEGYHFVGRDMITNLLDRNWESSQVTRLVGCNRNDVLTKFLKRQALIMDKNLQPSYITISPEYSRYISFVVPETNILQAKRSLQNHITEFTYNICGDKYSEKKHNCCSFVAQFLRWAEIDINFNYSLRSPDNLKFFLEKYKNPSIDIRRHRS